MPNIPIRLAALWVALMLTYLLGDVLRIFAGDFKPGEIGGVRGSPAIWLGAAAIMLVPIAMVVVSVTVDGQVPRWIHIVAAIGLFGLNLVGLPTYPGLYDRFLIAAGLVLNALTVWTAWGWETS
jgi:hypothetical protein